MSDYPYIPLLYRLARAVRFVAYILFGASVVLIAGGGTGALVAWLAGWLR